jgi:ubiquinone/menaquinone biosynthesis C-methylase UbiE
VWIPKETADDRILDVGCGAGQTTRLAAHRAYDGNVVGIDLSASMLERARRDAAAEGLGNISFEQGPSGSSPRPDRSCLSITPEPGRRPGR